MNVTLMTCDRCGDDLVHYADGGDGCDRCGWDPEVNA